MVNHTMSRLNRIHDALLLELKPDSLTIDNESYMHAVPDDSETHFKIIAVSLKFNDLNRITRHRLVNACLKQEFLTGLHALSLHLYTLDEWAAQTTATPASPACHSHDQDA